MPDWDFVRVITNGIGFATFSNWDSYNVEWFFNRDCLMDELVNRKIKEIMKIKDDLGVAELLNEIERKTGAKPSRSTFYRILEGREASNETICYIHYVLTH